MAMAVVGPEGVVPEGAWTDIDRDTVRRIEQVAAPDDLDGLVLELLVRRGVSEPRWRARVDRRALVGGRQGERRHVSPVRPDERLDLARDR